MHQLKIYGHVFKKLQSYQCLRELNFASNDAKGKHVL